MKGPKMRTLSAMLLGGALLIAGFFLLVMLSGCAVGYTEPATDGSRAALLGWKLDDVAAAGGKVGGFFASWLGSPESVATLLGGGGAIGLLAGLVRAWSNQKARAASSEAASAAHDDAWDEASGAKAAALAKSAAVAPVLSGGAGGVGVAGGVA